MQGRFCILLTVFLSLLSYSGAIAWKWSIPMAIDELNSKRDEFAPSYNRYDNSLYFNSTKEGYSLFYRSFLSVDGKFLPAEKLGNGINKKRNNQSYITFIDAETALFSSFVLYEKRSFLNLFTCSLNKNAWGNSRVVDSLSGEYFASHPATSPDGSFIVFASNKGNTNGDTDLWICFNYGNGSWSGPESLSKYSYPDLNTTGDEITPYIGEGDTLYFASNGRHGLAKGDFDIFFSAQIDGKWRSPQPLSELNSSFDDSDFSLLPDGRAIFASNRSGNYDLYVSKKEYGEPKEIKEKIKIAIGLNSELVTIKAELKKSAGRPLPYIFFFKNHTKENIGVDSKFLPVSLCVDSSLSYGSFPGASSEIGGKLGIAMPLERLRKVSSITIEFFSENDYNKEKIRKRAAEYQELLLKEFKNVKIEVLETNQQYLLPENIAGFLRIKLNHSVQSEPVINTDIDGDVITDPEELTVFVNTKDEKLIKKWRLTALIGNDGKEIELSSDDSFVSEINANLDNIPKQLLVNSDELVLRYVYESSDGCIDSTERLLLISHIDKIEEKTVTSEGEHYFEFYLFSIADDFLIDDENIKLLQYYLAYQELTKSIEIQYFDENRAGAADKLKKYIEKNSKLTSISLSKRISPSRVCSKNIILIRIKKK